MHKTKPAVVRLGADDFSGKVFSGKVSEPVFIGKIDLDKIDETLEKYEKEMVKLDHETAIIVTKEGKVFSVVGEKASVNFRNLGENALEGATVTHNHPISETRFSFSHFDITEVLNYKLHRLRGVDEKYVYEVVTDKDTLFGNTENIKIDNRQAYYEVLDKARFGGYGNNFDIDIDEFHEINNILAKKYKYYYRRWAHGKKE